MRTPCFIALTRPVSAMGLPMSCVVVLAMLVMGGFIASGSFLWFGLSALIGYVALRTLAAFDPRFFDVLLVSFQRTPLTPGWFKGKGVIYRA